MRRTGLTLQVVRDEFAAAGLHTADLRDGGFTAFCPACPGVVTVREDGEALDIECTKCDCSGLGDALHLRAARTDHAGETRCVRGSGVHAPAPELLQDVLAALRLYCHLEEDQAVFFTLALAAASRREGSQLWGLLVGASSSGKTELISLVEGWADASVNELTEAGLHSWTKHKPPRATGLLTRVPSLAFVTISDLSTLLAGGEKGMRDRLFADLRCVYDGSFTRDLGQQAVLAWRGQLAFLGAVTDAIDRYASHADQLGPRWLYLRFPPLSERGRQRAARLATDISGSERQALREDAQRRAVVLLEEAARRIADISPSEEAKVVIEEAAMVAAAGRSVVPRHGYGKREITGEATREEPMRLVVQLVALYQGALAIGLDEPSTLRLLRRSALDSMPLTRRKVLGELATGELLTAAEIGRRIGTDRKVVRFSLEELHVVGVCRYEGDDQDDGEEATRDRKRTWRLHGPDGERVVRTFAQDAGCGTKSRVQPPIPPQKNVEEREGTLTFVPLDARVSLNGTGS